MGKARYSYNGRAFYTEHGSKAMSNNYTKFLEMNVGDTVKRPVLISSINENKDKNGKPFLKIGIKDGFSDQTAMMFDTSAEDLEKNGIKKDMVVDVTIAVSEYMGGKSFRITQITHTSDTGLSMSDFIRLPPIDLDLMYDEIISLINSSANDGGGKHEPLSDLAVRVLTDNKKQYMFSSAAVSMHHNMRGGLLYHSYRMVKAADALCGVYTELDRELMLCGTALHDIGKIWEYKTSGQGDAEVTASGVLFGHLYLGASLIRGYAADHNYDMEKVQLLVHMILSHHGTHEFGAVTCPATAEAFMLHYIDNIDAKLYMCEDLSKGLAPGGITDKKPFGLDNRIYRPKNTDTEE